MNLAVEMVREPGMTVCQWERFLHQARQAGAADDAPVAEVMSTGDDEIIHSYRVEVSGDRGAAAELVSLPVSLVHDLLFIVGEVAKSDGDVRGLVAGAETTLHSAHDHLLVPVLGENPFRADSEKSSE
ncbi:MAG: hypothetical protein ACYCO9_00405 [Streptosporangiaceae bacterium]|jgi:hypothetical protein